jgi:hypothetical protein
MSFKILSVWGAVPFAIAFSTLGQNIVQSQGEEEIR